MDIDWIIVGAQIVNFVALVWLLHRFLYEPIVNAISAREHALQQRFERAESLQAGAAAERARYETKRAELDDTREQFLQHAREEAQQRLTTMLDEAEAEARAARTRLARQLDAERRELEQSLQAGAIDQAGKASELLLRELAGRSVADGVIDAFAEQLRAPVPSEEGASVPSESDAPSSAVALPDVTPPLTLRTSFAADGEQRARLRGMLERATGKKLTDGDVEFVHDETLVIGVELHFDGSVLAWHARRLLDGWEADALRSIATTAEGSRGDV